MKQNFDAEVWEQKVTVENVTKQNFKSYLIVSGNWKGEVDLVVKGELVPSDKWCYGKDSSGS